MEVLYLSTYVYLLHHISVYHLSLHYHVGGGNIKVYFINKPKLAHILELTV